MSYFRSMTRLFRFTGVFAFFLFFSLNAHASHVPGGNITYECVGPNTYVITLTVFEDCGTAFYSNGPESISVTNSCGISFSSTLSLPNITFQQEVSQLCPAVIAQNQSECNGGSFPGVYMHVWRDTVVLPANCDGWTFSFDDCCRNSSNNLTGSSNDYYWESVLNSTTAPCNSSPVITAQPIPYNCVNQPVTYNFGVYEPDGDSLSFSLIGALTGSGTTAPYQGGYTGASPIAGINIDPNTGEITFTPTITGNFVVAVYIEEFNSSGNLVGSIIQDFQFEIITCTNINPTPPTSGLTNFTSTGILTGPFDIQACEGDSICFDIEFTDTNPTDSIYINSNITQLFPGATMVQNSFFSPATASFCLIISPGTNSFSTISITANDNACPIVGVTSSAVGVTVITSTYAGQDVTMCQGIGTQLQASGGSTFNWTVLSGDPISIGNNFSCNNCPDPIANPAFSTVYQVVSNLSGGCDFIDTVVVNVVPDFNYSLTQSSTSTCMNADVQLSSIPTVFGAYTHQWSPATNLNYSNVFNPVFNTTSPGSYDIELTLTSALGCVKVDTININVVPAYAPSITLTANDSNITCGDSVFMDVDLGGGIPAVSGPSGFSAFSGPFTSTDLGTGQSNNQGTIFPAPFGNWYRNAKHQFLFTAAELQAAGFVGGIITEIAWETTAQNTATANFNSFTINMGYTTQNNLTTWLPNLSNVFSPQNIIVNLGWNTFQLTTAYEWDGISNLVVEICYDNLANTYSRNWSTPYTTTPFNSVLYYRSDVTPACPFTGAPITSSDRPDIRFTTCPAEPDPNNYSFQWNPPIFLSSAVTQNPFALPMISSYYSVVTTDLTGGCTDTASLMINVICDTCDAAVPTISGLTCYGGSDASVSVIPGGIDGPPWLVQLMDSARINVLFSDSNVVTSTFFDSLSAGSYVVRSLDTAGCYADTIIYIPDGIPMVLSISNDTIICIGGTADISCVVSGGTSPYGFNWTGLTGNGPHTVSPTYSQYYKVSVTDSSNCISDFDSVLVALNPPIILNISNDTTICPYLDAVNSVATIGGNGGPYNYVWVDDNGANIGNTSSLNVTPIDGFTYYYVTVTDNCETPSQIDSLLVDWYDLPTVTFDSDTNNGCYPVQVYFYNTTNISQVASCDWDLGNGFSSTNTDTVINTYANPGIYNVFLEVTSPEGCINDTTFYNFIEIYDYPTAGFISNPNPGSILTPKVQFSDSSSSDVVFFEWTFYDSTYSLVGTSNDQNPTFIFSNTIEQDYPVELYVENQYGCSDSIFGVQVIQGQYAFYMPNSFTPNGDGLNDYFYPIADKVDFSNYQFQVFNRWGEVVFSSMDLTERWDGTFKGQPAIADAYLWTINLKNSNTGELKEIKGYVLLSR